LALEAPQFLLQMFHHSEIHMNSQEPKAKYHGPGTTSSRPMLAVCEDWSVVARPYPAALSYNQADNARSSCRAVPQPAQTQPVMPEEEWEWRMLL
jgi:hypothetical protein